MPFKFIRKLLPTSQGRRASVRARARLLARSLVCPSNERDFEMYRRDERGLACLRRSRVFLAILSPFPSVRCVAKRSGRARGNEAPGKEEREEEAVKRRKPRVAERAEDSRTRAGQRRVSTRVPSSSTRARAGGSPCSPRFGRASTRRFAWTRTQLYSAMHTARVPLSPPSRSGALHPAHTLSPSG